MDLKHLKEKEVKKMANTFRKVYKKTGNSGTGNDYQLVGNIEVNGVELDIMKGASSSTDGEIGLVPKPLKTQQDYLLSGSGVWVSQNDLLGNTDISSIGDGTVKGNIALLDKKYRGATFLQGLFDHRSIDIKGVENCYGIALLITNQNINDVITFNGWSKTPFIKHNGSTGVTCRLNQSEKKITIKMPTSYNHGFVLLSGGIVWVDSDVTVTLS